MELVCFLIEQGKILMKKQSTLSEKIDISYLKNNCEKVESTFAEKEVENPFSTMTEMNNEITINIMT